MKICSKRIRSTKVGLIIDRAHINKNQHTNKETYRLHYQYKKG